MVGTHIQEQLPSPRDKGSSNKVLYFATGFILPICPGFVKHHPYVSLDLGTMIQTLVVLSVERVLQLLANHNLIDPLRWFDES
jgi:hypothetical protein